MIPASSLPNLEIPQRPTERKKTIERADTFTRLNKSDVHTINGTKPHQHLETDFQEDTQATYVRQEKNTLQTTRHGVSPDDKQHCPHHPYERHVRFDSIGQAWCNRLDCWDCYRLMAIGEALGYPCLVDRGGECLIQQGQEVWSHFARTQRGFLIMLATEEAIITASTQVSAFPIFQVKLLIKR